MEHQDKLNLPRRTVLRGMAVAGTVSAFGLGGFAGTVAAATQAELLDDVPDEYRMYTLTPSTPPLSAPQVVLTLKKDGSVDDELTVVPQNFQAGEEDASTGLLQAPTTALNPADEGYLYGVAINDLYNIDSGEYGRGWVFKIDLSNGEAELINDTPVTSNTTGLNRIWGSTFAPDGTYYGFNVTNRSGERYLWEIGFDESAGTVNMIEIGALGLGLPDAGQLHAGLSWDTENDQIVGVLGNFDDENDGDEIVDIDPANGQGTLRPGFVLDDTLELVCAEYVSCATHVYTVRNGSRLNIASAGGDEYVMVDLAAGSYDTEGIAIKVDNLAATQLECDVCAPCSEGETELVRYEWEEDEEGEYTYLPEGSDGNISLVGGDGQEVCFETDYCTLVVAVKGGSGPESWKFAEFGDGESPIGEFCVDNSGLLNQGGQEPGISHVSMFCEEPDPEDVPGLVTGKPSNSSPQNR